jgi:hypothetical protein
MPTTAPGYAEATERLLREAEELVRDLGPHPAEAPALPSSTLTAAEKAAKLHAKGAAAYLFGAVTALLGGALDIDTFTAYLASLFKDMGDPRDPLERMLAEQLVLAHHVIGRLHVRAGGRSGLEAVQYHAAAARLMAEFRRGVLALQSYRQSAAALRAGPAGPPAGGVNGPGEDGPQSPSDGGVASSGRRPA